MNKVVDVLRRDCSGASAAEFAIVLPLLLLFLFGIIDAGRFAWECNEAEKATQVGARVAVVTDPPASGITSTDFVGVGGLTQGDRIPADSMPTVTCSSAGCSACADCPSGIPGTFDSSAFDTVVARMQYMKPDVSDSNVVIEYSGSGLGYAGDPNGSDIAPLVTVKLQNLYFRPFILFGAAAFAMPGFQTTLTAEDLSGTASN